MLAVIGKCVGDLRCEFAGGNEDERRDGAAGGAVLRAEVLEDGQGERGGFAGPGLRVGPNVAARGDGRDGLRLHRRGHDVVACGEGTNESRRKTESGKRHGLAMTGVGGIWNLYSRTSATVCLT